MRPGGQSPPTGGLEDLSGGVKNLAGELQDIVGGGFHGPLAAHVLDAAQEKLAEPAGLFDLPEYRLDNLFAQPVGALMATGLDLRAHGLDARRCLSGGNLTIAGNGSLSGRHIDGAVIGLRAGRQLNIGRQLRAIDRVFLSLRGINVNGCFGRFACIRSFCLSLAFASSRVSGPSSRQIAINAALFQRCKIPSEQ